MNNLHDSTIAGIFREIISFKIDDLEKYSKTMENLLDQEKTRFKDWFKKQSQQTNEKEREELYKQHMDNFENLDDNYPNILRISSFLTCYSLLEHQLRDVCKVLQEKYSYLLKPSDLKDQGITLYKTYLKKVVEFDFPDRTKEWQNITEYNRLRNIIIHEACQIDVTDSTHANVKKFIENSPFLELDSNNFIFILQGFLNEMIKNMRIFFVDFNNSWEAWIKKKQT